MSFFKKLNTLVQAHIHDLVDHDRENPISRSRQKFLARHDINVGLSNDVQGLRKRVDEALAYETELQDKITALYAEVSEWDEKADTAVRDGRENDARYAVERLQQAQREIQMNESALNEHRIVTQELISQVNMLEAVVEQSKRAEAEERQQKATGQAEPDEDDVRFVDQLGEKLDHTRRQLSDLINRRNQPEIDEYVPESQLKNATIVDEVPQPKAPRPPVDRRKVDDDLAERVARLSKPPAKPKD